MTDTPELPPLPEPLVLGPKYHESLKMVYTSAVHYTADQMREYARAAVLAEREACARVCEEDVDDVTYRYCGSMHDDARGTRHACAAAIRARTKETT